MKEPHVCPYCGSPADPSGPAACAFCLGQPERWEAQFAPIPLQDLLPQTLAWLSQLPLPCRLEIHADARGVRLFLAGLPGRNRGALEAWSALTRQQCRWIPAPCTGLPEGPSWVLKSDALLPNFQFSEGDGLLALGGRLKTLAGVHKVVLHLWLAGHDVRLQEKLRALSAYMYGSDSGVSNQAPNPWGSRLAGMRGLVAAGLLTAGISGGVIGAGWLPPAAGLVGVFSGTSLAVAGLAGTYDWLRFRSVPREVVERCTSGPLFQTACVLYGAQADLDLLSGTQRWVGLREAEWPGVRAFTFPLPASAVAALLTPPQGGESSGLLAREARQEVPYPPPAGPLVTAGFRVGASPATGEPIGIDPDGHGVIIGGSRSGKSSLTFALLQQLIRRGADAPGIFLVDPHLSLADAFLCAVNRLPPELREEGIRRLRVITPERSELVPLNLLAIPEFHWAGNAMVQIGRRIWEDYWGPRMQAALLGLFRLAHAWNMAYPDRRMGLLHTVFAAFNADWRHDTLSLLDPIDRLGSVALDALLGQLSEGYGKWDQGWVTEVVSPVLSKVMALELSPWLFASLHQNRFVDMQRWVQDRAWIVLKLPAGAMGREAAKLTAGVLYNVFDAAFRRETQRRSIPFYYVIDEAQEIAGGMRLESMLGEGAKFGARMFVLAQSLAMMRQVDGFETVVQAMLANSSTQAFFSPDPEDGDLIRATLASEMRYGDTTLDLPSLHAWLRARIGGRWQAPTVVRVEPLPSADPEEVDRVTGEVIRAHPEDYCAPDGWQDPAIQALQGMIPPRYANMLSLAFTGTTRSPENSGQAEVDTRRLGF